MASENPNLSDDEDHPNRRQSFFASAWHSLPHKVHLCSEIDILDSLSETQMAELARNLFVERFDPPTVIVEKGVVTDLDSKFYMIAQGRVSVTLPHDVNVFLFPGEYFGERALISHEARGADVVATSVVTCLSIDRRSFNKLSEGLRESIVPHIKRLGDKDAGVLSTRERARTSSVITVSDTPETKACRKYLREIPLEVPLTEEQVLHLSGRFRVVKYEEGDQIIKAWDMGNEFFLNVFGTIRVPRFGVLLKEGTFFGERALLKDAPRACNVEADTAVTCMVRTPHVTTEANTHGTHLHSAHSTRLRGQVIDRDAFWAVTGPMTRRTLGGVFKGTRFVLRLCFC
jgi:CRP-like cAMP-binding protein